MNPKDKICVDVPLFIRLLEYAREDAKTDMDLHNVAENAIELSKSGETLGMQEYALIVSGGELSEGFDLRKYISENRLLKKNNSISESDEYNDEEILQRTKINQLPPNWALLDVISHYEEHILGYLKNK